VWEIDSVPAYLRGSPDTATTNEFVGILLSDSPSGEAD
jgi:hypothetical protein